MNSPGKPELELLRILRSVFVQRDDTYAVDARPNPTRVARPLTDEVLRSHLLGRIRIISYPTRPSDVLETLLLMFDIDVLGERHESGFDPETAEQYAASIHDALLEREFNSLVERSRSDGWHLWTFFTAAVAVPAAKRWGETLLRELGLPRLEVFPMGGRGKPFGRAPFLPLHGAWNGHPPRFLRRAVDGFEDVEDVTEHLYAIQRRPPPKVTSDSGRAKATRPRAEPRAGSTSYGRAAAAREAERLHLAPERNPQLFKSAAALSELVAGGELTRQEAYDALRAAGEANGMIADDGESRFHDTFERGFEAGAQQPRQASMPSQAARASGQPTAPEPKYPAATGWRDATMGELFVRLHTDRARFDHTRGRWLLWNDTHWTLDAVAAALELARETAQRALVIVNRLPQTTEEQQKRFKRAFAEALAYWQHRPMEHVLRQAASMPPLRTTLCSWNQDAWALNCANGTLNLKTGELRPHDPKDLFDYVLTVPYDSEATCPRWERFLLEVFNCGNLADTIDLIEWLQRAIGWSLSGDGSESMFFIAFGMGDNGKSVFLETLGALFGSLGRAASANTLLAKGRQGGEHSEDVARLAGARFVTCSEFPENRRLNESLIKDLTGGDEITARFLYKPTFQFRFTGSIWVRSNHKPVVAGDDDGIWRRMKLIRFPRSFKGDPNRDPHLREKLTAELPGILAWAARGLRMWEENGGIGDCRIVDAEVRSYREDMDVVAAFLADHCEIGNPIHSTSRAALYGRFTKVYGSKTLTANQLTRRIREKVETGELAGVCESGRAWNGIRLIPEAEP